MLKRLHIFLALLCMSIAAVAQTPWDGISMSTSLQGSGTQQDPWIIATPQDLKFLQQTPDLWTAGNYFMQIDDVDLGDHELGVIGWGDGVEAAKGYDYSVVWSTAHKPFAATYDGKGHVIRNLKISWDNTSDAKHHAIGLFGFLCGTVRNLHIDRAHMTRTASGAKRVNYDIKLGILAGAITPNPNNGYKAVVENLIISRSRIDDGGYDADSKSYYVGGVVGDITSGFGNTYTIGTTTYGTVTLNRIYAQVDIDLWRTTRTRYGANQPSQFNVGGILGRLRRGKYDDLPANCSFSGDIRAPYATIAPHYSLARCNAQNDAAAMTTAYQGEVLSIVTANTSAHSNPVILNEAVKTVNRQKVYPDNGRFYGAYRVFDVATQQYVDMTDRVPVYETMRGNIRTLGQTGATYDCKDSLLMRSWQGVNHGTYVNLSTAIGRNNLLEALNAESGSMRFVWNEEESHCEFRAVEQVTFERTSLRRYEALLDNYKSSTQYKYVWKVACADGTIRTLSINKGDGVVTDGDIQVTEDMNRLTISTTGDFRLYTHMTLLVYDENDNLMCQCDKPIEDIKVELKRTIALDNNGNKDHYAVITSITCEGHDYATEPAFFDNLTPQWQLVYEDVLQDFDATNAFNADPLGTETNPFVAHLKSSFVGLLRLTVLDNDLQDGFGHPAAITHSVDAEGNDVDYIQHMFLTLHVQFSVREYDYRADSLIKDYNLSDYYFKQGAKYDFYNVTYDNPISGTVNDTIVRPIVFDAQIVDQFGNNWLEEGNLNQWRIQWNYHIPGDGGKGFLPETADERKSSNYDRVTDDGYNVVNGLFDATKCTSADIDPSTGFPSYGLLASVDSTITDWLGPFYRNHPEFGAPEYVDRTGQFVVTNHGTRFIIHPNLLYRTEFFWVRARVFDVKNDPQGSYLSETVMEFNHLSIKFDRGTDSYTGRVVYRGSGQDYNTPYEGSRFVWLSSTDPTNYTEWTQVGDTIAIPSTGNRTTTLHDIDPNLYYKLVYISPTGVVVENVIGPTNTVYVYDRAATLANRDKHDFSPYDVESDDYFPAGSDINMGYDPHCAVATMKRAFELLDANGTVETNRIVLMGYYDDPDFLSSSKRLKKWYNKPVTLTGRAGNNISGGTLAAGNDPDYGGTHFSLALQAPMKWENFDLYWNGVVANGGVLNCLYCYYNDFTVGEGVRMVHFRTISSNNGLSEGVFSVNCSLVAGYFNNNLDMSLPANKIDYSRNQVDSVCTITLHSGAWGRIIGAARNESVQNGSHNICGAPNNPNRVRLNIDIQCPDGDESVYMPSWVDEGGEEQSFTNLIGLLVGGQTDGSTYSDTEVNIYNGHIQRYASGNITFGRTIPGDFPDDSFFGSTILNLYNGRIDELYGGSLGRVGSSQGDDKEVEGYFYGQSIINIYGGSIGDEIAKDGRLFAAGAGCITGLGERWGVDIGQGTFLTYTPDKHIPYYNNTGTLCYGTFDEATAEGCSMPVMDIYRSDGTTQRLDLAHSRTEINLYGGTVYGEVYGGGLGFSDNLTYRHTPHRMVGTTKRCLAGNLYGESVVRMLPHPDGTNHAVVTGNIYGAGSGSEEYVHQQASDKTAGRDNAFNFERVAQLFGRSEVTIEDGVVYGDVYGAGMGIAGYGDMATMYGDAHVNINGGDVRGDIFGAGMMGDVRQYTDSATMQVLGGNTWVNITDGTLGNCVFGGGRGLIAEHLVEKVWGSNVDGSTNVNISGGNFSTDAYSYDSYGNMSVKGFNIYGGGAAAGTVSGDTHVTITRSPFTDMMSMPEVDDLENPADWGHVDQQMLNNRFDIAWGDVAYRHFCVYGGGYGDNTTVCGSSYVDVNIPAQDGYAEPTDAKMTFHPGQTLFDIAGGGYSGNLGRYEHGDAFSDSYIGGDAHVAVEGNAFVRKVIGGGFYASVRNTTVNVKSGSVQEVYGGGILGYVHDATNVAVGTTSNPGVEGYEPENVASENNSRLFVLGNVFGGNDVKGIVGTDLWRDNEGNFGIESTDGGPLYTSCTDSLRSDKGVHLALYGGTICGSVYGGGNGHYRGYYVGGWPRYKDGADRHYRKVRSWDGTTTARVYRNRPMTGLVRMLVMGNSASDRVNIRGNLYGGGQTCTIGAWNTVLPFEDPRRLTKGGYLHVNFGGYSTIDGSVYMGSRGALMKEQTTLPDSVVATYEDFYRSFNGSRVSHLNTIGDAAYDHWFWNETATNPITGAAGRYEPGFPGEGKIGGNSGLYGEHMFRGYMKNVEMNGDVELTFWRDPWVRDELGGYVDDEANSIFKKRKGWRPGEVALDEYDAEDVVMGSFFLGGECGSMTNNKVMKYAYPDDPLGPETWGTIYRVVLPRGVTVRDKVVMGSESAVAKFYPYNDTYTALRTEMVTDAGGTEHEQLVEPQYTFNGGVVTNTTFSYDLVYYNYNVIDKAQSQRPEDDRYLNDGTYLPNWWAGQINDVPNSFMKGPDTLVVRGDYLHYRHDPYYNPEAGTGMTTCSNEDSDEEYFSMVLVDNGVPRRNADGTLVTERRRRDMYGLALFRLVNSANPTARHPYMGWREQRDEVVVKLTASCQFDPQPSAPELDADNIRNLYGGLIYGGCYNSGTTIGDVVMNLGANLLGPKFRSDDQETYNEISTLRYNLGRVFGGGFGPESCIEGDTYVNLLNGFVGMNVFGGGMSGSVNGNTQLTYIGNDDSYVFGSIYGGGLRGSVGTKKPLFNADGTPMLDAKGNQWNEYSRRATNVRLFSGNVDKVYGGSCIGDVYGAANVYLCDEIVEELDHLDYQRLIEAPHIDDWGHARLVAGSVYGGNDISGDIYINKPGSPVDASLIAEYDAVVRIREEGGQDVTPGQPAPQRAPAEDGPERVGKDTPGSVNGYNGFPLVGNLYGGSNGNYGRHTEEAKYRAGSKMKFATGIGGEWQEVDLGNVGGTTGALAVPHLERVYVNIEGGTIINAYGGGDMATVTEETTLHVAYNDKNMEARAGFTDLDDMMRMWRACRIASENVLNEVTDTLTIRKEGEEPVPSRVFKYQIYRLFGGNNHATMSIQPTWDLQRGFMGSIYSGGNFGMMTYYNPTPDTSAGEGKGITLTLNSHYVHADAVYGGGRVGDIRPDVPLGPGGEPVEDPTLYGATLNIYDGVIDHVYGGNDVSGNVYRGTNVTIRGAISGDVYCAGNGNYLYQYDPSLPADTSILEGYDDTYGGRYFILPYRPGYGDQTDLDAITQSQKIMAINAYRPNIERASMTIEGGTITEIDGEGHEMTRPCTAYVHGSVYMGGNSSTIFTDVADGVMDDIHFDIGDNVILNRVYMGSNGEGLTRTTMMRNTELLNHIDLSSENGVTAADITDMIAHGAMHSDAEVLNRDNYSSLLDLYMRAVEVEGLPSDFSFRNGLTEAYIGDFYIGGNCGSMITSKTIKLTFPHELNIFGKIVGGCNNANVIYKGVNHRGGLTRPLNGLTTAIALDGTEQEVPMTDKVWMRVHSTFLPRRLVYPVEGNIWSIRLEESLVDSDNNPVQTDFAGTKYYPNGTCNVYGGCYNGGYTVGNVKIDLYSDMLGYGLDGQLTDSQVDLQTVVNGINDKQWRSFAVVGGGFGNNTTIYGDIDIRVLPDIEGHENHLHTGHIDAEPGTLLHHPSCATIFGGSQEGMVIGNTTIEMRDGTLLTNMYGASEANRMYGSTQILIGYPRHYVCQRSGQYFLQRADNMSRAHAEANYDGTEVVKTSVWYRAGDFVAANVFEQITNVDKDECFALCNREKPQIFGATWDDISINIGDPTSRHARTQEQIAAAPFYGHGNIYGGGFVSTGDMVSLAGRKTLCRFDDLHKPLAMTSGYENYGGNSTIMVGDNLDNRDMSVAWNPTTRKYASKVNGADIRDHITIGAAHFIPVALQEGDDKMGYYYFNTETNEFQHQPSGAYSMATDQNKVFYRVQADGGIYGGGRKVFCEGFRACDVTCYGYADYTPQFSKLLNSFQRLDLLSINDCCLQLQGANDFAANTVDATVYSMTRIGELRMNSSLALTPDRDINGGEVDMMNIGNTIHDVPRSRNFLGFFHNVKYLGALVSNVGFDTYYHNERGEAVKADDGVSNTSYQTTTGAHTTYHGYRAKKAQTVDEYYASMAANGGHADNDALTAFKRRNLGTSANMIGINNGYQLKIQGVRTCDNGMQETDSVYYGPAIGVTEVKLLTLCVGEGGGYVYALNQHEEHNSQTPNFLQRIGNFVFPGAAFKMNASTVDESNYNYIIDDCFPVGRGYDYIMDHSTTHNVNHDEEIHYWYVNGQRYFYNATITAYTATSKDDPKQFYLDNSDNLIMLPCISDQTDSLRIMQISWRDPEGMEHNYDLTRLDTLRNAQGEPLYDADNNLLKGLIPGYNLYLSIDKQTANSLTPATPNKNGAWVAELTRYDFKQGLEDGHPAYDDFVNLGAANGSFGTKTTTVNGVTTTIDNVPLLGIMLRDAVNNNDLEYYNEHLSQPVNVKIVIGAKNIPDDAAVGEDNVYLPYEYTVNLTIVYIKGPSVRGNIMIENCALPGERIYANAYDVVADGDDESMFVSNRRWFLYKTYEEDGNTVMLPAIDITEACRLEADNEMRIGIPAYWFMDGWKLSHSVTMNGQTATILPNDTAQYKALQVHNYHRMFAWDYSSYDDAAMTTPSRQDLQLVRGARVYIKNARDMRYFMDYLRSAEVLEDSTSGGTTMSAAYKAAHRAHIGSLTLPAEYDGYVVVNPQNADSIVFFMQDDVSLDAAEMAGMTDEPNLVFGGIFSGDGHIIRMGRFRNFIGRNNGRIYNTGFISSLNDVTVIRENTGRLLSCFYYNDNPAGPAPAGATDSEVCNYRGQFLASGYLDREGCDYQNCYQNACLGRVDNYGLPAYYTDDFFTYGRVGYNLNALYLNERYKLGSGNDGYQASRYRPYVPTVYYDGEYRYANFDPAGIGAPTALRTDSLPNYHDALALGYMSPEVARTATGTIASTYGQRSTHHNCEHLVDEPRAVYENGVVTHYTPRYPLDYIYFGQNLGAGNGFDVHPHAVTPETRIYRTSGFYGTREDRSFYFNRDCVARDPALTAIDFTGRRTRDRIRWYADHTDVPEIKEWEVGLYEWPKYARNENDELVIHGTDTLRTREMHRMQRVFYPPVLDLPTNNDEDRELMRGSMTPSDLYIDSFTSFSNATVDDTLSITKNLLVYTNEGSTLFDFLHYTDQSEPATVQADDQNTISGHHILWDSNTDTYTANAGLFHLVDKQNFNAPIAFKATDRAWYYRLPATFSNGNTAWEGVCLPFTATQVRTSDYSYWHSTDRSHGVVTHFYGAEADPAKTDGENILHEYWLRSLTGWHMREDDSYVLEFTRPLYADGDERIPYRTHDAVCDTVALVKEDIHYSNTWFSHAYGNATYSTTTYNPVFTAPQYTAEGRDMRQYPYLTASVPYIVSFPGDKYYEFSMSGGFYAQHHTDVNVAYPQIVTYEHPAQGTQACEIQITDDYAPYAVYGVNSTDEDDDCEMVFTGTFAHRRLTDNEYVVITPPVRKNMLGGGQLSGSEQGEAGDNELGRTDVDDEELYEDALAQGTYFSHRSLVRPFRVFLNVPTAHSAHLAKHLYIGTRSRGDVLPEDPNFEEQQTLEDSLSDQLRIWVENGKLHIFSTRDRLLPLHTISGLKLMNLRVHAGTTVYPDLHSGCYIINRSKYLLK